MNGIITEHVLDPDDHTIVVSFEHAGVFYRQLVYEAPHPADLAAALRDGLRAIGYHPTSIATIGDYMKDEF